MFLLCTCILFFLLLCCLIWLTKNDDSRFTFTYRLSHLLKRDTFEQLFGIVCCVTAIFLVDEDVAFLQTRGPVSPQMTVSKQSA